MSGCVQTWHLMLTLVFECMMHSDIVHQLFFTIAFSFWIISRSPVIFNAMIYAITLAWHIWHTRPPEKKKMNTPPTFPWLIVLHRQPSWMWNYVILCRMSNASPHFSTRFHCVTYQSKNRRRKKQRRFLFGMTVIHRWWRCRVIQRQLYRYFSTRTIALYRVPHLTYRQCLSSDTKHNKIIQQEAI